MYIYPFFQWWPQKIYGFIKASENYVLVSFLASSLNFGFKLTPDMQ